MFSRQFGNTQGESRDDQGAKQGQERPITVVEELDEDYYQLDENEEVLSPRAEGKLLGVVVTNIDLKGEGVVNSRVRGAMKYSDH